MSDNSYYKRMQNYMPKYEAWLAKKRSIEQTYHDEVASIKRYSSPDWTRDAKLAKAYQRLQKRLEKHEEKRPIPPRAHPRW